MPSGLALHDNAVERARTAGSRRVAEPTASLCRRHAVGPAWSTPTAILARRPVCQSSVVTGYADGPDIWPSA
jgi:hypothetical protein